jgi:hypothetical protein
MLNTKPHTVTREVDGEVVTLVFYPDTGCLRFANARGVCHELRPPHSWLAMSATARGVCRGTQATTDGLSVLLTDFCAQRPRWLSAPERVSVYEPADEPTRGATREVDRGVLHQAADDFAGLRVHAIA